MRCRIFIFKIKDTSFIRIDNMGIQIFIIPLMLPAVGHMHMTMYKIFRLIFVHHPLKKDPLEDLFFFLTLLYPITVFSLFSTVFAFG